MVRLHAGNPGLPTLSSPDQLATVHACSTSASDDDVQGDPIAHYDRWGCEIATRRRAEGHLAPLRCPAHVARWAIRGHRLVPGDGALGVQQRRLPRQRPCDREQLLPRLPPTSRHGPRRRGVRGLVHAARLPAGDRGAHWWDYLAGYDELHGGFDCAMRNESSCLAAQGCVWNDPDCENVTCSGLSEGTCGTTRGCAWDGEACQNQP